MIIAGKMYCQSCNLTIASGVHFVEIPIPFSNNKEHYHDEPGRRCFDRRLFDELKRDAKLILESRHAR